MDLSQVKLVAFDMDGTLLNSKHEVSNEFFKLFEQLHPQVHFVAASGRQLHSIISKLSSIKDQISIIAENGAVVQTEAREGIIIEPLKVPKLNTLITTLLKIDSVTPILCGKNYAYVENQAPNFISLFKEYYSSYKIVDSLLNSQPEDLVKIAIYHPTDAEKYIYPNVKHLESELSVRVSGRNWVDISTKHINKGVALERIQKDYGFTTSQTMVFGDYNNDLEMLQQGIFSYAMANAHKNAKDIALFSTKSNDELGVESVLEKLVKSHVNYQMR